jgi:uncharacterized repeat protein (TIGR01451 family)
MIHSSRRTGGVRSLVVLTAAALLGVVPLIGPGDTARADGPVGSGGERHHGSSGYGSSRHGHRTGRGARLVAATNRPAGPILPGRTYTWPFAVTNNGSLSARDVTFAAALPKSLQFVSGQQNCSWQGTAAVCHLGALKRGQTKTGMLTAKIAPKAPAGRTISTKARLSWAHSSKGRRAVVTFPTVRVAEMTDVAVAKTGPGQVRPGSPVPYRVTVTNRGTIPAKRVVLRDTAAIARHGAGACAAVAAGREEKGRQASGTTGRRPGTGAGGRAGAGNCHGRVGPRAAAPPIKLVEGSAECKPGGTIGGLVCALGTMGPGTSKSLVFKVRPKAKPGALIKAPARVTTATIDTVAANNSALATTRVVAPLAARARVPSGSLVEGTRRVPGKGLTELPATGLPAKPLVDVALALIGVGLILYRLGRVRGVSGGAG